MSYPCKSNDAGGFGTELTGISKNSSIPGKNNGFFEKIVVPFYNIGTLSYIVETCLVFLYMYGNQYIGHNPDKLQSYLAGFHSSKYI